MRGFNWIKKGLLYEPAGADYSHASHPCIIRVKNNAFIIAFTRRDHTQRSHVFLTYAEVVDGEIFLQDDPVLALYPGETGYFDCDGVISGCLIEHRGQYYLYYVGWQNLPGGLWSCDTGRAVMDVEMMTLQKEFPGPVLARDKNNPLFAAATAFYITDDGRWHTWYNSGIRWEKINDKWHHYYGIHYAHSQDGIDWECELEMILPFADKYEYAFGRPSVVNWDGKYHMWFAHRATRDIKTYRIGYASSTDGRHWQRNDAISGIDVGVDGWDSEMICYPNVFGHQRYKYMLYNGNGYGGTGFGYAVLENSL